MATQQRRVSGESSIYQDTAGRWHGYVSMGLKREGVRDRRHVSGVKRSDVVGKVRELEQRRDAGTAGASGKAPTISEWLDHWADLIAARRVRPSTLHRYRGIIKNQLKPAIGHHRLDRLQPEHVDAMYGELLDSSLSPATVLQVHRVLSRALKVAMQRGKVTRNVCALVDVPSVDREEVQPLTADEARLILAAASGLRNGARWSVALALGLRQGEALGLPWDAVDLDAGTLRVKQALRRQTGKGLVIVKPKSRAGSRTIKLPKPLIEALRRHRSEQNAERLVAGNVWQDRGLVFVQVNGRPIAPSMDYLAWQDLLKSAQVRKAKLHDARHTAATLLLQQGVAARVVMQILGHSQISLTLGTYSHVVPELAEDAANRMGDALWG